jgi:hypothetical protein
MMYSILHVLNHFLHTTQKHYYESTAWGASYTAWRYTNAGVCRRRHEGYRKRAHGAYVARSGAANTH